MVFEVQVKSLLEMHGTLWTNLCVHTILLLLMCSMQRSDMHSNGEDR